jgi:hypothetical protein
VLLLVKHEHNQVLPSVLVAVVVVDIIDEADVVDLLEVASDRVEQPNYVVSLSGRLWKYLWNGQAQYHFGAVVGLLGGEVLEEGAGVLFRDDFVVEVVIEDEMIAINVTTELSFEGTGAKVI